MLGIGALILPSLVMQIAGPASIIAWVILIEFPYLFAWVLALLSVRYPDYHELPLFIRPAFGSLLSRVRRCFWGSPGPRASSQSLELPPLGG